MNTELINPPQDGSVITKLDYPERALADTSNEFLDKMLEEVNKRIQIEPATHVHTYEVSINNTHTALMWCTACGPKESYTGLMAGHAEAIVWHKIGIGESNA